MPLINYATSNAIKFQVATEVLEKYGITLEQHPMDLEEIQSNSGRAIALHKVKQAYEELRQPVLISDDTWNIPGLKGFPGAYMKDMNQWFTPDDFLRLTLPLNDRRVFLTQHVAYQDEYGQHYFAQDIEGILLTEIRGEASGNAKSFNTVISFDGGKHSSAEIIATGKTSLPEDTQTAWNHLGEWLQQRYT